jgi:GH35 family endo-1,4-beta-xylanase
MRSPIKQLLTLALSVACILLFTACTGIIAPPVASTHPEPTHQAIAVITQPTVQPSRVIPQGHPQFSGTVTPIPTLQPIPTPLPQAPTATVQPVGPGGLEFPLRSAQLEFGAAAHLFYTDRYTPLNMARDANLGWIRQQIHWKDQEGPPGRYAWGELDNIVADVNANGLKLLISIVRSPDFYGRDGTDGMPADPEALGNFVAALAEHYRGRVHAIQIWNEQNLAHENGGYVELADAGRYVELLKVAYTRIKAVDPSIIVVTGAPASTAVNSAGLAISDLRYYDAMFAYQNGEIRNSMDALAIHPGGSANPPETLWPENPSQAEGWTNDATFYFRNIENVRKLMEEYDIPQPVWITEFGWATANNTPGFEFGNQVNYDQQAAYSAGAMRLAAERYPWIEAMFVWNLNFAPLWAANGNAWHEQASFSILNPDYTPRPAFYAIQQYIVELRAQGR